MINIRLKKFPSAKIWDQKKDESNISLSVRIIMYFVGLIWSFIGVAIVADIFMCAIEGKLIV